MPISGGASKAAVLDRLEYSEFDLVTQAQVRTKKHMISKRHEPSTAFVYEEDPTNRSCQQHRDAVFIRNCWYILSSLISFPSLLSSYLIPPTSRIMMRNQRRRHHPITIVVRTRCKRPPGHHQHIAYQLGLI